MGKQSKTPGESGEQEHVRPSPSSWRERDRWSSARQSAAEGGGAKRWLEEDHRFLSPSTRQVGSRRTR